jgi:hypothetical protein
VNANNLVTKLNSSAMAPMVYERPYNKFWEWKIEVEASGRGHILDNRHMPQACTRLLNTLPSWQTYRGVQCNYGTWLPISLSRIADAYDQIRKYDLLSFNRMPQVPLQFIWHELGRVKTISYKRSPASKYHIIAVCKPLMFIWGQTPPFDSINHKYMHLSSYGNAWDFQRWVNTMTGLRNQLLTNAAVITICQQEALRIYGSNHIVPYGRFLDIYYH